MPEKSEVIWPLSVRLIHWLVAIAIILDAFWIEDAPHRYLGYFAAILVFIRAGFGLFAKGAVSFSSMPLKLQDMTYFLKNHFKGKCHYEAHNPLASLVYILIWGLVIALAVTGWMMGLDAYWGDETLEKIHTQMSDALIGLTIVHFIGIVFDSVIYKRKSWMGMINGRKN